MLLLQHFKTSRFAQQNWSDRQTSTHIIDARSNTCQHSLYFHSLLLFPTLREPLGPHSSQQKLASAVTALWVESQIITSPIGLDSGTKGWGWGRGGGYDGGFFFLSLSLSLPPSFFPPVLLLLLLHPSILSPPFCLRLPFWLAPFFKAPLADGELATRVTRLKCTAG